MAAQDLNALFTNFEGSDTEDDGLFNAYTNRRAVAGEAENDPLAFLTVPQSPPLPGQAEDPVNADIARLYTDEKFTAFTSSSGNNAASKGQSALQSFISAGSVPSTSREPVPPSFAAFHSAAHSSAPFIGSPPTAELPAVVPLITGISQPAPTRKGKKRKQSQAQVSTEIPQIELPETEVEIDDTPSLPPVRPSKKTRRQKDASPVIFTDALPSVGRVRLEKRRADARTRHIERPHIPEFLNEIDGPDQNKSQIAINAIKTASSATYVETLARRATALHTAFINSYQVVGAELRDAEIEEAILRELRDAIRTQKSQLQEKIAAEGS